jgi:hypothetical protein
VPSGVRVRLPPGALMEHWPSGYGSAPLRRTPGDRCEGSSPSCSARGWLTELARCPAGNRRLRLAPQAGSIPAPSANAPYAFRRGSQAPTWQPPQAWRWKGKPTGDGTCLENRRAPQGAFRVRLPVLPPESAAIFTGCRLAGCWRRPDTAIELRSIRRCPTGRYPLRLISGRKGSWCTPVRIRPGLRRVRLMVSSTPFKRRYEGSTPSRGTSRGTSRRWRNWTAHRPSKP